MALPFFYIRDYSPAQKQITLDEDTSRHVVQVLRMKIGEQLKLTDGHGNLFTCEIIEEHKKHTVVSIIDTINQPPFPRKVSIGISLLKNSNRFEWFLEKATELGVAEIIPLICHRTEKEKFRHDRMQQICISAMLQSQQVWLPILHEPKLFNNTKEWKSESGARFIAHCIGQDKKSLKNFPISQSNNSQIIIGPEGDFTNEEVELAIQEGFTAVSLGETRLRTETAGVVAATLLCIL